MNSKSAILLFIACLAAHSVRGQTSASSQPITLSIPFAQVRSFLPAENVPFVVWRGAQNKWPHNKDKGEFMMSETGEVAFGRGVRANPDDRKKELSLGPGITARDGYLEVQAGWRVHKSVPKHPDYFDGTIGGKVFISIEAGETKVRLEDIAFHWNPSMLSRLVDVNGSIRASIERELPKVMKGKMEAALKKEIEKRLSSIPSYDAIKSKLSVKIKEDGMIVTISQ